LAVLFLLLEALIFNPAYFADSNYAYNISVYVLYPIIYAVIYLIFGVPTTLITDYLLKAFAVSSKKYIYLISFFTYSIAGVSLTLAFTMSIPDNILSFISILIPVYIYLIVLLLLRKKGGSGNYEMKENL
jgi:hypothetical protein